MKNSSKRLLTWLYTPTDSNVNPDSHRLVPQSDIEYLLPDLTQGGRRSLITWLVKKQLLATERSNGQSLLRITTHGKQLISEQFPALLSQRQDWQGRWSLLLFIQAPSSDPQFRYLRNLMVEHRAGQLTRGVYLYPDEFPPSVIEICHSLYRGNAIIYGLSRWRFGDERSIVTKLFTLSDIAESLSGISTEIDQLLRSNHTDFDSIDQHKHHIFLVFDRLYATLHTDVGLVHHYFNQVPSSLTLLSRLQTAVNVISDNQ